MDLIVNAAAAALSSRGVRRYYESVTRHLRWPGRLELIAPGKSRSLERPRELLRRGRRDAIFWTPCQRGPLLAHHHVVTVHDCINVEFAHRDDWRLPAYRLLFGEILRRAASVVAISHATKAAVLRNYRVDANKIVVIPSGHDGFEVLPEPHPSSGIGAPYVLMVTNPLPHKNNLAACLGFARSRVAASGVALCVVGTLPDDAVAACKSAGIALQVLSNVDDARLAGLYENCRFLLSASLAEGHNLPIAEARARGVEVLCSDIAVHREYYEGQVRFFDASSADAIASAIDAAMDAARPWFTPKEDAPPPRSFSDVANDYRSLFMAVAVQA